MRRCFHLKQSHKTSKLKTIKGFYHFSENILSMACEVTKLVHQIRQIKKKKTQIN